MSNITPLVSIGLPVYNGENFVAEAIESHLGQTLADFELVISDKPRQTQPKRSAGYSPSRTLGSVTTVPM